MAETQIPQFWTEEIRYGRVLGEGSYCEVLVVEDIVLRTPSSDEETIEPCRTRLAERYRKGRECHPNFSKDEKAHLAIFGKPIGSLVPPKEIDDPEVEPPPLLALKRVRTSNSRGKLSSEDLLVAQEDLHRELDILRILRQPINNNDNDNGNPNSSSSYYQHPNIIELFGVGWEDGTMTTTTMTTTTLPGPDSSFRPELHPSFLLLSRIQTTLSKRIVRWRDECGFGVYETLSIRTPQRRNQWVERILLLSKIAHALEHLHSHKIIYRDIKPENIGFDAMDIPRLFDMGLAKKITSNEELRSRRQNGDNDDDDDDEIEEGLFHLTPETGTLRYMSVENGKGRPYGWSSDVYSLGILMHEVLSLKVPFGGMSSRQYREVVWIQGQRLGIDRSWPEPIRTLLPQMWDSNPIVRPKIQEVVEILNVMLRGKDQDLFPKGLVPRAKLFGMF